MQPSGCHTRIGAWEGKYLDDLSRYSEKNKAIVRWVFRPFLGLWALPGNYYKKTEQFKTSSKDDCG